jgi:anti-sigma B factor antagonist
MNVWEEKLTVTDAQGTQEGERILQLNGPITITTLFALRDTVRADKTAKTVILDFSHVPYADSAGVGVIVNAHVSCLNSGRRLVLVAVQDRIRTLMKNTRVDEVLTIFPTLQEAQSAMQ